jgi:hypothetical protein
MKPRWLVATIYDAYEMDVKTFVTKQEAKAYYLEQKTTLYETYLAKIDKG